VIRLQEILKGVALWNEMIPIDSPKHWQATVRALDDSVDALLPVSIPAYPTDVWNSHPQVLVERGLPVILGHRWIMKNPISGGGRPRHASNSRRGCASCQEK
jgi:hypothetical protein